MSTSVPSNDSSGGTQGDPAARPTSPGPDPDDLNQGRPSGGDRAEREADVDADVVPGTPRNPGPNPDDLDQ